MTTVDAAAPTELVKTIFDRLNDHDVPSLLPLVDTDVKEDWPIVGRLDGPIAVRDHFAAIFAAVPDFKIDPETIVGDTDAVFVHWHAHGTFTGAPYYGLAATGHPIDLRGTDYFTFRDGKVASNFVAYDGYTFAVQAGVLPAAGSTLYRLVTEMANLRTRLLRTVRH